jgi:hypothetical protein
VIVSNYITSIPNLVKISDTVLTLKFKFIHKEHGDFISLIYFPTKEKYTLKIK